MIYVCARVLMGNAVVEVCHPVLFAPLARAPRVVFVLLSSYGMLVKETASATKSQSRQRIYRLSLRGKRIPLANAAFLALL